MHGIKLRDHWEMAQYLWKHKKAVYANGRRLSVSRWRLIWHDAHKLVPSVWMAYVRYFHTDNAEFCPQCDWPKKWPANAVEGWEWPACTNPECVAFQQPMASGNWHSPPAVQLAFDRAWRAHQQRPHHWQAHILIRDTGDLIALEMPDADVREMVADWAGASAAAPNGNLEEWWRGNRYKMYLHDATRALVERYLQQLGVNTDSATLAPSGSVAAQVFRAG